MTRQILLTGLRRSGLHACVNNLMGHFPGEVFFINNPDFAAPDLEKFRYSYEVTEERIREMVTEKFIRKQTVNMNFAAVNRLPWPLAGAGRRFMEWYWKDQIETAPVTWPAMIAKPKAVPDTRIILVENSSMHDFAHEMPGWLKRQNLGQEQAGHVGMDVGIILRSPWNCLASELRKKGGHTLHHQIPADGIKEAWKGLAREALGQTKILEKAGFTPWVLVYDHYFASRDYREKVAARFSVPPNETGMGLVSEFGNGSSFDGLTYTGGIRKTAERWKHFADHPLMKAMQADAELMDLAAQLGLKLETV